MLPQVKLPGQEITVQGRHIFDWFTGISCDNRLYFTYAGSQTITPYAESAIYILFPEPLTLSEQQVRLRSKEIIFVSGTHDKSYMNS